MLQATGRLIWPKCRVYSSEPEKLVIEQLSKEDEQIIADDHHLPRAFVEQAEAQQQWFGRLFYGKEYEGWFGEGTTCGPFLMTVLRPNKDKHGEENDLHGRGTKSRRSFSMGTFRRRSHDADGAAVAMRATGDFKSGLKSLTDNVLVMLWKESGIETIALPATFRNYSGTKLVHKVDPAMELVSRLRPYSLVSHQEDLLNIENFLNNRTKKVGVLYARRGQKTENEFYANETGPDAFYAFCDRYLGERIKLKGFNGYKGGLDVVNDSTGVESYYSNEPRWEVMYHVSTLLPFRATGGTQIERKRHIGNDLINIIYVDCMDVEHHELGEDEVDVDISKFTSKYVQVYIVVIACKDGYLVSVGNRPDLTPYGPIINGKAIFYDGPQMSHFLKAKIANGTLASSMGQKFKERTRRAVKDLLQTVIAQFEQRSSWIRATGGKKKIEHKAETSDDQRRGSVEERRDSGKSTIGAEDSDIGTELFKPRLITESEGFRIRHGDYIIQPERSLDESKTMLLGTSKGLYLLRLENNASPQKIALLDGFDVAYVALLIEYDVLIAVASPKKLKTQSGVFKGALSQLNNILHFNDAKDYQKKMHATCYAFRAGMLTLAAEDLVDIDYDKYAITDDSTCRLIALDHQNREEFLTLLEDQIDDPSSKAEMGQPSTFVLCTGAKGTKLSGFRLKAVSPDKYCDTTTKAGPDALEPPTITNLGEQKFPEPISDMAIQGNDIVLALQSKILVLDTNTMNETAELSPQVMFGAERIVQPAFVTGAGGKRFLVGHSAVGYFLDTSNMPTVESNADERQLHRIRANVPPTHVHFGHPFVFIFGNGVVEIRSQNNGMHLQTISIDTSSYLGTVYCDCRLIISRTRVKDNGEECSAIFALELEDECMVDVNGSCADPCHAE
eukprot:Clim_evm29s203 gene=Clim_evmTU29s203